MLTDGNLLIFTCQFRSKMSWRSTKVSILLPVYIENCKQDLKVISNDKNVCVRCSVLGFGFLHRRVGELATPARARLVWLQYSSHLGL